MKSYPLVMFYFILFDQFHHRVGINDVSVMVGNTS